ncbi:hypothetical protein PG985_009727 [Apiospora marii]|uniref:uncharacterized protein n=1 Tax=Apiospora marii TaxID=335849 RepID=UPI00312E806A
MAGYPVSDTIRTFSLTALSILLLPLSLLALCLGRIAQYVVAAGPPGSPDQRRHQEQEEDARDRRTVLVTGVGMAKGLTLARAFHLSGHRVIGADFEAPGIPCSGRSSRSLSAFYRMPKPDHHHSISGSSSSKADAYVERLVDIVRTDGVDLWVSCSGVASAAEDAVAKEAIERRTRCKCIQFDLATTMRLHEKDAFMRETARLGLPCPETHTVTSQREILRILDASSSAASGQENSNPEKQKKKPKQFILKPIGVDDANRGNMTLLPLATRHETEAHLARLPVSAANPWIVQQFVPGGAEYCTHALVVRGQVRCFAACPSAELLMHYQPLPAGSALFQAMLKFTREFVARSDTPEEMTGHLSFDFMVEEDEVTENGFRRSMYAIECNPRAHTAVVLFARPGPEMRGMVRAYLSAAGPSKRVNGSSANGDGGEGLELVVPPADADARYWIGHDLVSLVVHPAYRLVTGRIALQEFLAGLLAFFTHVLTWKEGTWEAGDPWPAVALYHAYWPLSILGAWRRGQRWSRVNVSTTKMFGC